MTNKDNWKLRKVIITRDGLVDKEHSGYELSKNDFPLCKFSLKSLIEVKKLFELLDISNLEEI